MREFNLPCLKTVILTVIYCILAGSGMTYAQKVITGTVTDSLSGSTLPGVSVNVQGTLEGVSTEIDGTFELSTEQEKVILVFRSEENTSELQSLMRITYAVFCLKKNKTEIHNIS